MQYYIKISVKKKYFINKKKKKKLKKKKFLILFNIKKNQLKCLNSQSFLLI
jgi:hypothetical protein